MRIEPASDASLSVRFDESVSSASFRAVLALLYELQALRDSRILNIHPAYASVLIDFDPLRIDHDEIRALVQRLIDEAGKHEIFARLVRIPICYDDAFGLDLPFVAAHTGLSAPEIVRLHSSASYVVHFLGFSPGFAYLGGLPEKLEAPRLESPRKHVAAGSVGIAGRQTGIYPVDSPGGWRLIGRTPFRMFDPLADPPTRLQPGDEVQFEPIDRATFDRLAGGKL
jgi:inhibitor of KinA